MYFTVPVPPALIYVVNSTTKTIKFGLDHPDDFFYALPQSSPPVFRVLNERL